MSMEIERLPARILLLCNAEHGQANIMLAVAYELLRRQDVELHFCSFPVLKKRFDKLLLDHNGICGRTASERAFFHELSGPTVTEVFLRCGKRGPVHATGVKGCIQGLSNVFEDYWGWEESEYVATYESCAQVISRIGPDLVVIDYFFLPGRDAVQNQKGKYCLMNTTSLSHIVLGLQPKHAWVWKYPM
jgi:2-acylglycerol O-acyltransferase 1